MSFSSGVLPNLTQKSLTFRILFFFSKKSLSGTHMLLQLHMKETVLISTLSLFINSPAHCPMGTSSSKVQKGF